MFLIRRGISSRKNVLLMAIQEQFIASKNVDATSFPRGVQFCQQRLCASDVKQQTIPEEKECQKHPVGVAITKLKLMFTCKKCDTRNDKLISKLSYEQGVVIVRCDGCKNNHLIADNLGWFYGRNERTNIEYILRKQGENVRRIAHDSEGYLEFVTKEILVEFERQQQSLSEKEKLSEDNAKQEPEIADAKQEQVSDKKGDLK